MKSNLKTKVKKNQAITLIALVVTIVVLIILAGVNKWANVKTTGGGNNCYFVWIPRYAYKVPNRSTESTIEVKFLEGTSNNPIDGSNITISNNTTEGSWNISPAFWWDKDNDGVEETGEQLTGIWVAKYEASSSNVSTDHK